MARQHLHVLPDGTISADGSEDVVYQPINDTSHNWTTSGTHEEWREHVGMLASGNTRLVLAISAGFTGSLLQLVGAESGGLHLYGSSSEGKTTALIIGGSVCGGGGKLGFAQSWRSTGNALEAIAEAHNDGTLFLDELAQVDAREAAEIAYLLSNGEGKARMNRSAGTRTRMRWRIMFVSSGEMTLAEHAASAGVRTRGGAEVRLLNIRADAGKGFGLFEELHGSKSADVFANRLQEAARRYFGAPLRAFIARTAANREEIRPLIKNTVDAFVTRFVPPNAKGEVKRAAGRFGA